MKTSFYAKDEPRALMAQVIMRPLVDDSINSAWIDGSSMCSFASTFIKPSRNMTSLERLEVYNQQYWYRLLDSLRDDFPGLLSVIGDYRFTELAQAYLMKYPSHSFTLCDLGERLSQFIDEERQFFTDRDRKLVLDIVNFEWSEIKAFDAQEKASPAWDKSSTFAETDPILELQPYIFILSLDYAVDDFLLILKKSVTTKTVLTARKYGRNAQSTKFSRPKKHRIHVVIHRHNNCIFYKRINIVEYKVLSAIKSGLSINDAVATITEQTLNITYRSEDATGSLRESFSTWTKLGWFCSPVSSTDLFTLKG
jgi:hypothetical protein